MRPRWNGQDHQVSSRVLGALVLLEAAASLTRIKARALFPRGGYLMNCSAPLRSNASHDPSIMYEQVAVIAEYIGKYKLSIVSIDFTSVQPHYKFYVIESGHALHPCCSTKTIRCWAELHQPDMTEITDVSIACSLTTVVFTDRQSADRFGAQFYLLARGPGRGARLNRTGRPFTANCADAASR